MKPESGVRTYGGTTFFVCRGTAKPVPTVNWYINGRPLVGKYSRNFGVSFIVTFSAIFSYNLNKLAELMESKCIRILEI